MTPVPVTLITGFLGAGKTTFINWLIKQNPDKHISLILNEFGDVKLESQFIEDKGIRVAELANGCMCCVAKADIPRVVNYILDTSPQTEYIVVEASGMSDPAPVTAALTELDRIRLDTIVCVIDALNFDAYRVKYPLILSQAGDADLVVLSKVESVDPAAVTQTKTILKNNLGDGLQIFEFTPTLNSDIFIDPQAAYLHPVDGSTHQHAHGQFQTVWFQSPNPVDPVKLQDLIRALGASLIRVKGMLHQKDRPEKILLSGVGQRVTWLTDQWQPGETPQTAILFIGQGLSENHIHQVLSSA